MDYIVKEKFNKIVLASGSPRRIEMLQNIGFEPIIIKPQCEEDLPLGIDMKDAAMFLALKKGLWVEASLKKENQSLYNEKPLIISADTMVVYDNRMIGKPSDKDEAYDILKMLCGKTHYVISGVSLIVAGTHQRRVFYEITKVYFKNYTDEEIIEYINTDEPYDKAGGYAIQGTFSKYVEKFEYNLNNVIGLPLEKMLDEMDKL